MAEDFVSPENPELCLYQTEEFRHLYDTHTNVVRGKSYLAGQSRTICPRAGDHSNTTPGSSANKMAGLVPFHYRETRQIGRKRHLRKANSSNAMVIAGRYSVAIRDGYVYRSPPAFRPSGHRRSPLTNRAVIHQRTAPPLRGSAAVALR